MSSSTKPLSAMLLFKRHHQAPSPSNKLLVPTAKSQRALVPSLALGGGTAAALCVS
jgi:hypothetical protein